MTPTPLATSNPRLSGVLLRAKMARKCPDGTSMTRPVGTSAICPGASLISCDAARSKPAASPVAYVGRETVESSRLILRRIVAAAYAIALLLLIAAPARPQAAASLPASLDAARGVPSASRGKLPLDPAIHVGK